LLWQQLASVGDRLGNALGVEEGGAPPTKAASYSLLNVSRWRVRSRSRNAA
jgi:hypothetical protein